MMDFANAIVIAVVVALVVAGAAAWPAQAIRGIGERDSYLLASCLGMLCGLVAYAGMAQREAGIESYANVVTFARADPAARAELRDAMRDGKLSVREAWGIQRREVARFDEAHVALARGAALAETREYASYAR